MLTGKFLVFVVAMGDPEVVRTRVVPFEPDTPHGIPGTETGYRDGPHPDHALTIGAPR